MHMWLEQRTETRTYSELLNPRVHAEYDVSLDYSDKY